MSNALDEAAAAFSQVINAEDAPPRKEQEGESDKPTERVFGDIGDDDEEELEGEEEEEERPDDKELVGEDDDESEDDEGDEDDEDDEEDGDAEDEDEDDEEDDETLNQKFLIQVDGEEAEVTLKEALNGYIRQETFHRRLNALTEVQKTLQAEAQQVIQDRQRYMTQLEDLEKQMESLIPQEPDWDALYKEDPQKAREIEKQYRSYKESIEKVRADREKARLEAEEADARETAKFAQEEFPKFARIAKWKTKKDAERDLNSMRRTALAAGFTEEEVATVYDSRMLSILLKASKYDRMMAAKPRPVKDGKPTKGTKGAGRKRTAPKGVARASKDLTRSGSIEDAARVFHRVIQN